MESEFSLTSQVLSFLPSCHAEQKLCCLEIVFNNVDSLKNHVLELKGSGFEQLLKIRYLLLDVTADKFTI